MALSKTRLIKILHFILSATTNQTTRPVLTSFIRSRETFNSRTFSICNTLSDNHRVTKPANGTYLVHILIIYFSKIHFNVTLPIYCSISQTVSTLEDFTHPASLPPAYLQTLSSAFSSLTLQTLFSPHIKRVINVITI